MFRAWSFLVRSSYLLAVAVTLTLLVPRLADRLRSWPAPGRFGIDGVEVFWFAALLLGFIVPAILAVVRLLRRAALIPDAHLRESPIVSTLVLVAGTLGTGSLLLVAWILSTTSPAERHGANLAAPVALGLALLAFTLLTVECVLVPGSTERADARAARERVF